jgi:hypothetical protein
MRRTPLVLLFSLLAGLTLPASPATAETLDIEPTSWFERPYGHVTDVEFDPSGRMWLWNNWSNSDYDYGLQTHVYTKNELGVWGHAFRFRLKNHNPNQIAFDNRGRVYSADAYRCVLNVVTLKASGKVKSQKKVKFKGNFCPSVVQPINGRKAILVTSDLIREYKLPITSRSRPIREIQYGREYAKDIRVGSDGAVYIAYGSANNLTKGVEVYLPTQSGVSSPGRSFTIHADYAPQDIERMSFSGGGELAIKMASTIALFPTTTSGANQTPQWSYRVGEPSGQSGDVAFDPFGLMVVVDYLQPQTVRNFFEMLCTRRVEAIC